LSGQAAGVGHFLAEAHGWQLYPLETGEELLLIEKDKEISQFLIWARRIFGREYFSLSGLRGGNYCVWEKRTEALTWRLGVVKKE
jgi:hypothetical protein